jgi:hypothetical protein
MFFNLPVELQDLIYQFDNSYRIEFNKCINELKKILFIMFDMFDNDYCKNEYINKFIKTVFWQHNYILEEQEYKFLEDLYEFNFNI